MAYNTPQYRERLRAHCSVADIARWKEAATRAGARNLSEWVRWVLDKEAAMQSAASRNPWVDRKTGRAKQLGMELGSGRGKKVQRGDPYLERDPHLRRAFALHDQALGRSALYDEADGL